MAARSIRIRVDFPGTLRENGTPRALRRQKRVFLGRLLRLAELEDFSACLWAALQRFSDEAVFAGKRLKQDADEGGVSSAPDGCAEKRLLFGGISEQIAVVAAWLPIVALLRRRSLRWPRPVN